MSEEFYRLKYLKYKIKYLELKMTGGDTKKKKKKEKTPEEKKAAEKRKRNTEITIAFRLCVKTLIELLKVEGKIPYTTQNITVIDVNKKSHTKNPIEFVKSNINFNFLTIELILKNNTSKLLATRSPSIDELLFVLLLWPVGPQYYPNKDDNSKYLSFKELVRNNTENQITTSAFNILESFNYK